VQVKAGDIFDPQYRKLKGPMDVFSQFLVERHIELRFVLTVASFPASSTMNHLMENHAAQSVGHCVRIWKGPVERKEAKGGFEEWEGNCYLRGWYTTIVLPRRSLATSHKSRAILGDQLFVKGVVAKVVPSIMKLLLLRIISSQYLTSTYRIEE
jgi:hypothetical protein